MDKPGRTDQDARIQGGRALEEFVKARWPRSRGGIRGLAAEIGSSTETIYSWFRGDAEPNMGHLRELADKLEVRRSTLVAILDLDPDAVPDPEGIEARLRSLEAGLALLGLEAGGALRERRVPPASMGSGR